MLPSIDEVSYSEVRRYALMRSLILLRLVFPKSTFSQKRVDDILGLSGGRAAVNVRVRVIGSISPGFTLFHSSRSFSSDVYPEILHDSSSLFELSKASAAISTSLVRFKPNPYSLSCFFFPYCLKKLKVPRDDSDGAFSTGYFTDD